MFVTEFYSTDIQMSHIGDHSWSVARLFTLSKDLEVMDIPLKHLSIYHNYENLTLRELAGHVVAVNNADMSFPIILDEDGELMDGRNRLMRAMIDDVETIKAVRFEKNPRPCKVTSSK